MASIPAQVDYLALYGEAAARLADRKSRKAFAAAFGDACLAARGPAPAAAGASFRSIARGAEDLLAAWRAGGWVDRASISFEQSDLAEAAEDFAATYRCPERESCLASANLKGTPRPRAGHSAVAAPPRPQAG